MQVSLLRLIEELEFRAVGALKWRKVDLRIIAATRRDLKTKVAAAVSGSTSFAG
jgi:DNA-binding NtrC family response regulator